MKKFIKTFTAVSLLASASFLSNAALVLNITDEGMGQTRFEFSGSTIAASQTGGNGIWPSFDSNTGPVNTSLGCVSIASGSGTMMSTSLGTVNVDDACIFDDGSNDYVTPRTFAGFSWNTGDTLSWSGNIVYNAVFSSFAPGSYSSVNSIYGDNMFTDAVIVNVGPQVDVSAPTMIGLLGLALAGLGARRLKR
jgi:hypothetical protein